MPLLQGVSFVVRNQIYKIIKMVEVLFKGGKIQTGDRIKIPKAVMDTLNLEAGDNILIKFDPDNKRLIIEEG